MKIQRTKNALRNVVFGVILKIYQMLVPFLLRTTMIHMMGMQYVGLNSLFTSILQVLNLAELGVGSAMVFSMYKPIVDDDKEKICALMRLYKIYYRVIGAIVLAMGLVLFPFIPNLISGKIPDGINVYVLYLINLAATVLSYWLFAYKNSILNAHQRVDVISKVTLVTNTVQYAIQFVILIFFKDYYLYVIAMLFAQVLTNILTAIESNRHFPQYKAKGKLKKEEISGINRRIRDLFTAKVGMVAVNSSGTLVISAFLGLVPLGIYNNYYYLMTSIVQFILIFFQSLTAGIGNSLITESNRKNYNDYKNVTFVICWIVGLCTVCLICLYEPFMSVWAGGDNTLGVLGAVLFGIYFYLYVINYIGVVYKDAGGIWHSDRFRPITFAALNIVLSLLMVNFIGVYAVLVSVILSYTFLNMPWLIHNVFKTLFKISPKEYIFQLIFYSLATAVVSAVCLGLCMLIPLDGWFCLIVRAAICLVVTNGVYFLLYRKKAEFTYAVSIPKKIIKKFLKK